MNILSKGMKYEKSRKVSLQTKIVSLIIALILFVVLLLAGIFVYIQSVDTKRQVEQLALQTAKSLSFMPAIKMLFKITSIKSTIQSIAEQVREQAGADTVIIEDRSGVMYSHSNSELIGTKVTIHITMKHSLLVAIIRLRKWYKWSGFNGEGAHYCS